MAEMMRVMASASSALGPESRDGPAAAAAAVDAGRARSMSAGLDVNLGMRSMIGWTRDCCHLASSIKVVL